MGAVSAGEGHVLVPFELASDEHLSTLSDRAGMNA